jgi:hypothetical protein
MPGTLLFSTLPVKRGARPGSSPLAEGRQIAVVVDTQPMQKPPNTRRYVPHALRAPDRQRELEGTSPRPPPVRWHESSIS